MHPEPPTNVFSRSHCGVQRVLQSNATTRWRPETVWIHAGGMTQSPLAVGRLAAIRYHSFISCSRKRCFPCIWHLQHCWCLETLQHSDFPHAVIRGIAHDSGICLPAVGAAIFPSTISRNGPRSFCRGSHVCASLREILFQLLQRSSPHRYSGSR